MNQPPLSLRRAFAPVVIALGLLTAVLCAPTSAVEAKKNFDLPAGAAAETLKQFAAQAGREIVFAPDAVNGAQTKALKGEFTPKDALDQLLQDTNLIASQEAKTGAFAVKRDAGPNAQRAAQNETSDRPANRVKIEEGVVKMEEVEVTGSRLRPNTGEQPTQPILTYTSLDIERTGAANLGQLFQYIPAVTSFSTGLGTENVGGNIGGAGGTGQVGPRTTAQLRGGSETATLLLVDGRRVPLTGLQSQGGNGYDLGGIPLSAVERVEVLLDGASAIYGADAINGVINVILKKRYTGTEVRFNYDNTFDTDVGMKTASLTHGFASGKWSGLLTLSASDNNVMLQVDRYLTRSYDRTLYGGITNQSQPTLFVEGTGSLNVAAGNLPGTTTPRVAIPAGYAGGAITVADYVAAPAPVGGLTPGRQSASNYAKEKSAYIRLGYEFNDRLTLTGLVRMGRKEYRDNGIWRSVQNIVIPAGYAGNPFSVPVRLSKTFYDLPPLVNGSDTANDEFSLAATYKLPAGWRLEGSVSFIQGKNFMVTPDLPGAGGLVGSSVAPAAQFTARLNAEIAAGRNPILIYDSNRASPNSANALDVFWVANTQTRLNDQTRTWTYAAQADGRVLTLPAGDVKAVFGAERREEYVAFPGAISTLVWPVIPQRNVNSFFAEARIPVLGVKQKWPLFHQLDFNLAVRTEDYSDFGRATTPRYGIAWRPVKAVLVRASFGEGFLAPQLYRTSQPNTTITAPASTIAILFPGQTDLSRGNAPITGPYTLLGGGNPALQPQRSENLTYGIILDVPKVKGLSLSLDYYDNRYTDGFGGITSMMDRQRFVPETIFRGPKLATDPADWLGPITGYDNRTINISSSRSAGYSFGARYQRTTPWGDFMFSTMGEKTLLREEQILPGSVPSTNVNKRYVPLRVTTSLFWNKGSFEAGATHVYGGESWTDSNNVALFPSRYTDDVMRWDFSAGYDFGRRAGFDAKGEAWWRRALHDMKVRVTLINAFDTEPPLNVNGNFSSLIIDPRLRRYVLDVTKRF